MNNIPKEIQEYLSTSDSLVRAQISQQHPDLQRRLAAPEIRAELNDWLASGVAWDISSTNLVMNMLRYLRAQATSNEAPLVRSFLLHPNAQVRLAAYEFLLTLYYPDKNPEAMFQLLQNMLLDEADFVRVEGVRYVQQSRSGAALHQFLTQWRNIAARRGWSTLESFELVSQLLNDV